MHLPPDTSMAARLAEIERQMADLRQTGSRIYDPATGAFVPLSSLAFGQVMALEAGVGAESRTGPAGSAGSTPFTAGTPGPQVDVLVRGGRLRVDWASLLAAAGNTTTMVYSYSVTYIGPPDAPNTASTQVVAPDYYRAVTVRDNQNIGAVASFGSFAFHTGLTPGWYRVRGMYQLVYGSTPGAGPAGSADNPRLGATPY